MTHGTISQTFVSVPPSKYVTALRWVTDAVAFLWEHDKEEWSPEADRFCQQVWGSRDNHDRNVLGHPKVGIIFLHDCIVFESVASDIEGYTRAFDPEVACELMRDLLRVIESDKVVEVSWARVRAKEGNGGKALVTRDHVIHANLEDHMQDISAMMTCREDERRAKARKSPFHVFHYSLAFLADRPLREGELLGDLLEEAGDGDVVLLVLGHDTERVTPPRMVKLLERAGSTMDFFLPEEDVLARWDKEYPEETNNLLQAEGPAVWHGAE